MAINEDSCKKLFHSSLGKILFKKKKIPGRHATSEKRDSTRWYLPVALLAVSNRNDGRVATVCLAVLHCP